MSRLWALVVSLIYAAGGMVTGYYGYALRLQAGAAEGGLDVEMVTNFAQSNYILVGIALLLVAVVMHLSQIGKAKRVDASHMQTESMLQDSVNANSGRILSLEKQITENGNLIEFCRRAITDAAMTAGPDTANEFVEPPKDHVVD